MVAVNCAALPDGLLESELFGYARGAFTGAQKAYDGAFVRAHRSTLLLDEVVELKLEHQAKLLRVLQFNEVTPLGGPNRPIDVRIITATHKDLRQEVEAGRFRADLFYRVLVLPVEVPPLRERVCDIPAIAAHLLDKHADKAGRHVHGFSNAALEKLEAHLWPGNVRELENVILRAMLLADGRRIEASDLRLDSPHSTSGPPTEPGRTDAVDLDLPFRAQKDQLISSFERRYAEAMLEATDQNVSEAARRSGLDRKSFWSLLKRHGLTGGSPCNRR